MTTVQFTVIGTPVPKGSFRAYTYHRKPEKGGGIGARATNDNPATKSWQSRVAFEATLAMRRSGAALDGGGIDVSVTFYLPRPKSLKPTYDGPHVKKPDLDKLQRALMDGLKGVAYVDDSQVIHVDSWKHYARVTEEPRAEVTIRPIDTRPLFHLEERKDVHAAPIG